MQQGEWEAYVPAAWRARPPPALAAPTTLVASPSLEFAPRGRHLERLERGLSFEEFQELLADADTLMRSLPPTAQVKRGSSRGLLGASAGGGQGRPRAGAGAAQ